jgi:hypothetical protein
MDKLVRSFLLQSGMPPESLEDVTYKIIDPLGYWINRSAMSSLSNLPKNTSLFI